METLRSKVGCNQDLVVSPCAPAGAALADHSHAGRGSGDFRMEWVEAFYAKQFTWLAGDYLGEVQDHHRARAATVVRLTGPPPGRVLELGAGGGQDAAATADL